MSDKPKVLLVGDPDASVDCILSQLDGNVDIIQARTPLRALVQLARDKFAGIYVTDSHVVHAFRMGRLLQNERILEGMPDGLALLDPENTIVWANGRFREWADSEDVTGVNFYAALGSPEILGPDYCPFHTAQASGSSSNTTLRVESGRYYQIHAAVVHDDSQQEGCLVVALRDVTSEMLQQQKLAAIHRAGVELADMTPEELTQMSIEERIELLKSNILHYTKDLLNFDVVEIRLLDQQEGSLQTLLSVGFKPEASNRTLYAKPQGNGVTGFVAATGKSYLCEDTSEDPLYLEGCQGAKSSLTVPLVLHDEVIGTFNVESTEPRAFTESDLQFLEIFSRDLAAALNTLELLVAEQAMVAAESVDAIHSAVALPIDEILNDVVNVMERYIGHEPGVVTRLQRILRHARDIKQVIQTVGQKMAPSHANPQSKPLEQRPLLVGRRILVVDDDDSVRGAAHGLLERYGCIVETAHDGGEAYFMVRNTGGDSPYDVIIADIRLPDMSGFELFMTLKETLAPVPLALMTAFGYDPGHSIVKARQAGLKEVLYKPFRLDQLIETVERVITTSGTAAST